MSSLERIQSEQGNDQKSAKPNSKKRLNELGVLAQRMEGFQGRESLIRVLKYIKSSGKEGTNWNIILSSIILLCYCSYQALIAFFLNGRVGI